MKTITKIFIALILGVVLALGAFPHIAYADEIEIVPDVTYELTASASVGYTNRVYFEVPNDAYGNKYPINETNCMIGNYNDLGLVGTPVFLSSANRDATFGNFPLNYCANWYVPANAQDFSITFHGLHIALDMGENLNGYYRYTCDFLLGCCFNGASAYYRQVTIDATPNYTYNSAPLYISDSENGMHGTIYLVGQTDYFYTIYQNSKVQNGLVKFRFESTFYYDSTYGTEVAFDLSPMFSSMIGPLNYDLSDFRAGGVNSNNYGYYNNRFLSKLFGNVEPPVTPTPTVTPYPGQDTQESINQGVQTIIQGLDVQASPIPTPADLTIDETIVDVLETMTLPDLTDAGTSYSNMWDIFTPAVTFLALLASSIFVVSVFLWILRGGWL